ncbi:uncharacterized protein lrrc66 isoform X2 [Sebastes fasciatus]
MALAPGSLLAAVLLLVSSGLHRSSSFLAPCPESCSCQRAPLLNCSSSGLSSVPQHIPDSVTELDLSHNLLDSVTLDRPHRDLSSVWLGNNNIKQLSLCVERDIGGRYVRGRRLKHRLKPWRGGRGCVSWAPTLQLLSVERNQLEQLPQGMEGSESLQVLQLSFNKISTVQPGDLTHLRQLKELHLQHNLITSLHPQMFKDLAQLQVLDLSFNMLTSLHPLTYLSLRNIGADVMLGGNRWRCDCSMRSLRRRMAYDSSRGLQAWSMVCTSPSILSGRDLLQLEEDDLNCFSPENGPELHRDVTVYKGSEILLSCAAQDSTWWTPSGQAPVNQAEAGLDISDITETDTGLYVCVSEEHEVVSVFNLQIIKTGDARRKTRSLPRIPQGTPNRIGQQRTVTQSNLALAVSLSVLITFLIAFILGVIARPCIDALLRRVTKKKRSSAANSVSSVEQRQYDNGAFFDGEGPEHNGPHRERRVTFSTVDFREDGNVEYYDTGAGGNQGNINSDAVIECEAAEAERVTNTAGDSGSENSLRQSSPEDNRRDLADTDRAHNMEFEHIPDPVELVRRRSLSSSDSSQSDKVFNEDQMIQGDHSTPKTPQPAEDSVQQRADSSTARNVEVPHISIEGSSELPGFSSEPFADWSPHTNNTNPTDLWQENEEQFEFSDSARSMSARSSGVLGSFNASKLTVAPTSDKQMTDDMSSSSSYVSEDEPTQYVVNSDPEEENTERNHNKPEVTNAGLNQGASFEQQIHGVDSIRPSAVRPEGSFSSHSSDSDGEDYRVKKGRVPNLAVTSHSKSLDTRSPSPHAAYSSSSSSESEAEITDLKVEHNTGRMNEGIKINVPEMLSTDLDRQCIPQIKRHVDIKAPLPDSDSSSSDESTDEATNHMKKQEQGQINIDKVFQTASYDPEKKWPALDLEDTMHVKRRIDIKAPSPPPDSSSNSDSEVETTIHIKKQEQGGTDMARLPVEVSQNVSHDPQQQWPVLDLEDTMPVKNRLDVKAPSPASDSSSSSDSEDETTHHTKIERLPYQESQTGSHNPDTRWPVIDLEDTARVKKRLDIKAPSPPPDSSSSSDSEDETTGHMKKQEQGGTSMTRLPSKVSQTASYDAQTQWPVLDLEDTMRVKKRLDIKAPSPPPDSSSSSDSEDETTHHTKIERLPYQESQTLSHDPDTRWPSIDLEDTMRVKKRLDIKAPSPPPDSSSSSDSEDETTGHMKKQEQGGVSMTRLPSKVSQTASYDPQKQWPALDLEHTMRIKRRMDIKAPSPATESSSSSDSEAETTHHTKIERPGVVGIAGLPYQESQTGSHDPEKQWPSIDLDHIPRIKKRLDIKAPSPPPDSSFSSDSEDETTHHTKIERLQYHESQTGSRDPDTRWPVLDLEDTMRVKKRLDIKALSPPPDSSSSSDSEDETTGHIKKQEQGGVSMIRLPSKVSQTASYDAQTQWPVLDLEDTMRVKKRLDIKAPSPPPDSSSSSDSEDETTHHTKIERLPYQESQTLSHDPDTRWPVIDLEDTMRVKKRLDIKAPSPPPDSSSSSDSEDETTGHMKKQEQGGVSMTRLPSKVSQTASYDPQKQWPALDLEHTMRIKRRMDIKAPSPATESSSSSDSEAETTHHTKIERPGVVGIAGLLYQESQTGSHDPEKQWPSIDLDHIPRIKKRLDIKAPSPPPDSSFSSDSEDETTHHTKIERLQYHESQTGSRDPDTRWPVLDLEDTMRVKKRLDIKALSPPPDSSSSSDSEDETTGHMKKQEQGGVSMTRLPSKVSQTASYDQQKQWPALDLEHTMRIKRRMDIKAPSPATESSSSSDSEAETTHHTKIERPGVVGIAGLPYQESQTGSHDPEKQWPSIDLDHIPRIKKRLDIKAPSPPPDSSFRSDSEDETTHHTKIERLQYHESQTGSRDPDTRWPVLDLEDTMRVKKRLDIKALSPPPDSSSSSDSEDETTGHIKKQEQGGVSMTRLPSKVSQTASYDQQKQWPVLDLEHTMRIKRRIDIKAPSSPPDSSSSSDSEDETTHHTKIERLQYQESQTGSRDPDTRWPVIDLDHTMRIKRRLDIKAPSPPPDSSLSGGSTNHTVGGKSREAIKISPRHSSSSSDEQEESVEVDPDSRWPRLDLSSALHVKRRLDIKARSPPPESSSSSVHEGGSTSLPVKVETKLPKLSPGVPYINRRLDFSRPSEPNSSRSDSEDEYRDHAKAGLGVSAISKATEKEFIRSPKTPVINISRSPKTDIKLERYTAITNDVGDKTTSDNISTTPEINPELQSRWSTMNLGYSRFKKRLEISSHTQEPPNLPSTPPPDSPSSSSSESGTGSKSSTTRRKRRGVQEIIHTESSENKPVNVSLSLKGRDENSGNSVEVTERLRKDTSEEKSNPYTMLTDPHFRRYLDFKPPATPPPLDQPQSQTGEMQRKAGVELKSQASKVGVEPDSHSILTNIPHIKRALDIKAPSQRESSSSSNSEDEKIDHSVPDLSLGVPRVKRRLDVKAPLPEPSHSTSSGSENEVTRSNQSRHASNMSGLTDDDSLITYKRVIMKASLPPSNSFSPSGKSQTIDLTKQRLGDRNASLAPKRVPSLSFEDVLKKRLEQPRSTTDVDLPPEIRWRRHLGVGLSSPPAEPDLPPPDSSNSSSSESDDNIKQDKGKADVPLMHKHSSLGAYSVSLASSRALDKFDSPPSSTNEILRAASEERNERKGLTALKAMSSERQRWDTLDESLDKGASPIFDDHRTQGDGKGIRPLAKQPPTQLQQRSALDLLYGVPRYRRHDIEPPQGPPPPIPATPPPYEAVGLTWRSPQSGTKPGLGGTGNTEESDSSPLTTQKLAVYLDTSDVNISEV